jgi:hypothetical protein
MTLVRQLTAFAVGLGLVVGCSSRGPGHGEAGSPAVIPLQEVADLLRSSASVANRPAARLADFDQFQSIYSKGYDAVKTGEVIVLWGATIKGEGEKGGDEAVAAYEKAAPTSGGYVLLTSGEVKKMTAAEFQAAPKAGKS